MSVEPPAQTCNHHHEHEIASSLDLLLTSGDVITTFWWWCYRHLSTATSTFAAPSPHSSQFDERCFAFLRIYAFVTIVFCGISAGVTVSISVHCIQQRALSIALHRGDCLHDHVLRNFHL